MAALTYGTVRPVQDIEPEVETRRHTRQYGFRDPVGTGSGPSRAWKRPTLRRHRLVQLT